MTEREWLGEDNQLSIDIFNRKYRYNNEDFEQWLDRVSGGDVELRQLIKEKKFLFGGRTLSNRGIENSGSYFNCYSLGFVEDDYKQILQTAMDMGLTYKSQGGQGVSLTKIRPKGTPIGTRYESDGIVPFMKIFNTVTEETSQGGARKGALMISIDVRHKEAETFITLKNQKGVVEKANLSLEIDDEFMRAVKQFYETGQEVVLHEHRTYGTHEIEYDVIPIRLYKKIVQNCYEWGDPACLFVNRFRNYNLMEFDNNYNIEISNPCGEQPLPKNFCCNLGSLNLSEFVENPFSEKVTFNILSFKKAISIAVRGLDILIDENSNNHPLEAQRINSLNYRNIGLGVMGYATALMKLGITYGSEHAKEFTGRLFQILLKTAIESSVELAKKNGAFPNYSPCVFDSTIIQKYSGFEKSEITKMKKTGIRNCSLISIAPTGTLSTLLNVTGGAEPEYNISYKRKTESLVDNKEKYYDVFCNTYKEYMDYTGKTDMPEYFITSHDIYWKDRVDIQAIMQNYVDTAISSTVNLAQDTPIEEVEKLYIYAWENGLKGITIFRDGCKRTGILTTEPKIIEPTETLEELPTELKRGMILQINDDVVGKKRKLVTGCGSLHCVAFFDPDTGDLVETYLSKGSTGGCNNFMIGLSRMISLSARAGCDVHTIANQLNSCGVCPSYAVRRATKDDTSKGASCPIAIGNALLEMYGEMIDEIELKDEWETTTPIKSGNYCPECDEPLSYEGGCNICKSCGWSKCG